MFVNTILHLLYGIFNKNGQNIADFTVNRSLMTVLMRYPL
ncbi:hypothetical protein TPE_1819 [Treponema pedis str. T A4]|uniref:Uncharacterized protein n=1 Tax=Treponema pedis str. T A4 TaxID=1291379 RepID=S6A0P9_9SPIR|nr:hypothetical protein TPE_1819 [Treponema pedis str. T A4]